MYLITTPVTTWEGVVTGAGAGGAAPTCALAESVGRAATVPAMRTRARTDRGAKASFLLFDANITNPQRWRGSGKLTAAYRPQTAQIPKRFRRTNGYRLVR